MMDIGGYDARVLKKRKLAGEVELHLAGMHDQASHGNWAGAGALGDEEEGNFGGFFDPHGLADKNPAVVRAGQRALDAIGAVHGLERGHPSVIAMADNGEWLGEDEGSLGAYMPPEEGLERGRVVFRAKGVDENQMAATLIHELGHHMSIGRGVQAFHEEMAREGALSDLMDTLAATETVGQIREINKNAAEAFKKAAGSGDVEAGGRAADAVGFTDYLLMPEEVFARAYMQYVAVKSKERGVLQNIVDGMQAGEFLQWGPTEFKPVFAAFERYMKERGIAR